MSDRVKAIPAAYTDLTQVIDDLTSTIDNLHDVLMPVLGEQKATEEVVEAVKSPEYSVPLANSIKNEVFRLKGLCNHVRNLINSCEC